MQEPTIIVSIICCTYNHELYIRECLDGFMMQQTNFPFEVLIHDDASTDGTADIIREYEAKYPDIIKPIYQTENQYRKKTGILKTFQFPRAQGKYIALCEGDDYWTDPLKLQKQVDFLESHPDYVMCSHYFNTYNQEKRLLDHKLYPDTTISSYSLADFIKGKWCCSTLTTIFRKETLYKTNYFSYEHRMDIVLFYSLLTKGFGELLHENMATYRIHSNGVWSGSDENTRIKKDFDVRFSIYNFEKNRSSALLIENMFLKNVGRIWLLKNPQILYNLMLILTKEFGFAHFIKFLYSFFIKTRN